MVWPDPGNEQRQAEASDRDRATATRMWVSGKIKPGSREARVVGARMDHPGESWQQIADRLGMTKHAATGVWRRAVRRIIGEGNGS